MASSYNDLRLMENNRQVLAASFWDRWVTFHKNVQYNNWLLREQKRKSKMSNDTSRAGQTWEASEWAQLGMQCGSRLSVQTIAKIHKRTEGAVVDAFKKAGITLEGYPGYVPEYQMKLSPDQSARINTLEAQLKLAEDRLTNTRDLLIGIREALKSLREKLSK